MSTLIQSLRFMREPFGLLRQCREECGDLFSLKLLGLGEWIFLCSPTLAEEMFKAPDSHLSAGEANQQFLAHLLGTDSVIAKDGPSHRVRRGLLSTLLNGQQAALHTPLSRQITEETLEIWPLRQPFALLPHMTRATLRLLIAVIVGVRDRGKLDRLTHLAETFFEIALKSRVMLMPVLQRDLGRWSPWGRILHHRERLRAALEVEIEVRRRGDESEEQDILGVLLAFRHDDGEPLSNASILDEIINLISAGQETSSRILVWTVRGILAHPEVRTRVQAEIETVMGGQPIAPEHLPKLRYLDAVINEGIRYQPLGPFTGARRVKQPFVLGGHTIPAGVLVAHCHAEISQRDDLFERAGSFHPENFLDKSFGSYSWCPFGGGARTCIGRGLALVHLQAVIATIFQRTELELRQTRVKPVSGGFLLVPNQGLRVEMTRRR